MKEKFKFVATGLWIWLSLSAIAPAWGAKIDKATGLSAEQYREMGLVYRRQEKLSEAIAALQKAVELDPKDVSGRVILGWTQHLAGKEEEAATSLWGAIYLKPHTVEAFNALGIVYLVQGSLPHAVMVHSWAALLKPDNEIAYYNLSLAYHRQQQYDLAIANAVRAADLEPSNPHPLVALAIAHWDAGDRVAARKAYRDALRVDGRYSSAAFLDYLKEAGFSPEQIRISKQVLGASNS
ncbi:tetratricopeptide repeat protein [Tumidithrix helvetica PCC 7403]|uniref:tetratricopeptide repeat protein n=1 Tax=Tumidithrix helvetica TaxID=3457545 RepID=UPI003CAD6F35